MNLLDAAFVAGAGLLAGGVNSLAGGGTLISFPALLAVGFPAVTANITSSVGLVSGYLGGAVGYRRELSGQRARASSMAVSAILGGITGAVILLATPGESFRALAPYLVLVACALLLAQPSLARWVGGLSTARGGVPDAPNRMNLGLRVGIFVASIYGAYFGAGLGVLLLAVLGILLTDDLQRLNALKTVLAFVVNIVGVAIFLASGRVDLAYAVILAVSAYAGGQCGAGLARRLNPSLLRICVVVLGVVVSVVMLVRR